MDLQPGEASGLTMSVTVVSSVSPLGERGLKRAACFSFSLTPNLLSNSREVIRERPFRFICVCFFVMPESVVDDSRTKPVRPFAERMLKTLSRELSRRTMPLGTFLHFSHVCLLKIHRVMMMPCISMKKRTRTNIAKSGSLPSPSHWFLQHAVIWHSVFCRVFFSQVFQLILR